MKTIFTGLSMLALVILDFYFFVNALDLGFNQHIYDKATFYSVIVVYLTIVLNNLSKAIDKDNKKKGKEGE
ncbi:MAG: hypothetical protein K0R18_57 [Bacillales bacterium]|jgi:hypothetical protein|nr:hypothetical protein [Bacillales bacterium]